MRVVIDMQGAQTESRFRGIGRYALSFAKAVVRNRGDIEVILVLSDLFPDTVESLRREFDGLLPARCIRVWSAAAPTREVDEHNHGRREAAELVREAFIAGLRPDVVHVTSLFEGFVDDAVTSIGAFDAATPVTVTLYDLIPYLNQEQYLAPNPAYRAHYLRKIRWLRQAAGFLAISEYSRREGFEALGLPESMFHNVSTAIEADFTPTGADIRNDGLLSRVGIRGKFVLYTGGSDGRKNLPRLLEAYAALDPLLRESHQLVLAGKISEGEVSRLRGIGMRHGLAEDDLVFTGYVDDRELVALYQACDSFVFPSWHEGFGLPALEAMTCGAVVIGAGRTSVVEVVDLPEAMFDPFDVADMAAKLERSLVDEAFRARLRDHGRRQAGRFSWDETARRSLQAWRTIAADRSGGGPARRRDKPRLAFFSPLPPERSGIADYSSELLAELGRFYRIDVVVDQEQVTPGLPAFIGVKSLHDFMEHTGDYERILYQMGNSPFHKHMSQFLARYPGVLVLHDFYLSSLLQWCESTSGWQGAWTQALYESHGYRAVLEKYKDPEVAKRNWPSSFEVVRDSFGVIVHSRYSKHLLQDYYGVGDSAVMIPHLRAWSQASPERAEAKRRLGIPERAFLICSFGFLDYSKLNHMLLEAWAHSGLGDDSDCYLVFVGENHGGDYGARIRAAIAGLAGSDRVRITGYADPELYQGYLAAADLAVQLRTMSRGETSGTVLDCMSRGVPLVVNANGSMAELDKDAAVVLSDEFETAALSETLKRLRTEPEILQAMGEAGRRRIKVDHDPERCAAAYYEAIEGFYEAGPARETALFDRLGQLAAEWPDQEVRALCRQLAAIFPPARSGRRVLLDITATARHDLHTGIERVARGLLTELLRSPRDLRIEPVYLSNEDGEWVYRHARRYTLKLMECPADGLVDEVVDPGHGDLLFGLDISGMMLVEADRSGLLDWYRRMGVEVYFMVYDLLPIRMPEVFPPGSADAHEAWLRVVAKMDGAVCISQAVADDMREWLSAGRCEREAARYELLVSHLGADIGGSVPSRGVPADAGRVLDRLAARPTFLMVGTIEPRKGHLQVLDAFDELWRRGVDVNLVVVGREGWRPLPGELRRNIPKTVEAMQGNAEAGKRFFWLSDASDEYLERVYSAASCLVAASYGEGFGLPLIEAAEHGLPLLVRDIPVFREVAGDSAAYFDASTPGELADAIERWLLLHRDGQHPRSSSLKRMTWGQATEGLYSALFSRERTEP